MAINIRNPKGRDAVVAFEAVIPQRDVHFVDEKGKPVTTQKLLKTDIEHDLDALLKKKRGNLNALAKDLIKEDPEVDIEQFGSYLTDTSKVYVSKKGIIHIVDEVEVVSNPDGTLRERRPRIKDPQNINTDVPLRWTGKFIDKDEAAHRFVFTHKRQLIHVNGLTFDFLYEMAEELQKRNSLLLIRGGEKGDQPIVMQRGGKPYNAFLEGRVQGDSYLLVLQLSNMELKRPKVQEESSDADTSTVETTSEHVSEPPASAGGQSDKPKRKPKLTAKAKPNAEEKAVAKQAAILDKAKSVKSAKSPAKGEPAAAAKSKHASKATKKSESLPVGTSAGGQSRKTKASSAKPATKKSTTKTSKSKPKGRSSKK
ncbi:MAG: hypothetical protein JO314_03870 [Acidobacteria bacterium]|nr:hypothetical protein [Acidobacteriota bacterium]